MITGEQITAARALLRWSQTDLAFKSGVPLPTIKNFEQGKSAAPRDSTKKLLIDCFKLHDIEFIDGGVRERKEKVRVLEGEEGITALFDDIIKIMRDLPESERKLLIFGVDEQVFLENYPEKKLDEHITQRKQYKVKQKLLLQQGDENFIGDPNTYRWIPKEYFSATPTFVYGDKVSTILWSKPPEIIITKNALYSAERRRNFKLMWKNAFLDPQGKTKNE